MSIPYWLFPIVATKAPCRRGTGSPIAYAAVASRPPTTKIQNALKSKANCCLVGTADRQGLGSEEVGWRIGNSQQGIGNSQ